MASTKTAERKPSARKKTAPVLTVTGYDRISSGMIATVVALIIVVAWLGVVWAVTRRPQTETLAELELIDMPGGSEDGAIDETLRLDSPEDVTDDPSLEETLQEESEITEVLENVVELSDNASEQAQRQFELDAQNTGKTGSATGTGRRPLGAGPGESGLPREQRWFVRFSERGRLTEYARQLDFFGIELGAVLPEGKLVYLSQLSSPKPKIRTVTTGKNEKRMYMTWQAGGRKKVDVQLFEKAGVDVENGMIFHFYPRKTESLLARLEKQFQNRPVDEIRRTYFVVRRSRSAYQFVVIRQSFF